MLQRLASGDEVCGAWTRSQLLEMDDRFVAAVEAAFRAGGESLAVARATVSFRNGKVGKAAALEGAIEAAWDLLCSKKGQMSASEVVAFVRARCSSVDVLSIRSGIEQRLQQRGAGW
jgi:hypothetical protein